jgi:hypothetical protein
MPAVLLEAGSIINRDEELELKAPERRALISAAVVKAAASYCATMPSRGAHQAMTLQPKPTRQIKTASSKTARQATALPTRPTPQTRH